MEDKNEVAQATTAEILPNVTEAVAGEVRGVRGVQSRSVGWVILT